MPATTVDTIKDDEFVLFKYVEEVGGRKNPIEFGESVDLNLKF